MKRNPNAGKAEIKGLKRKKNECEIKVKGEGKQKLRLKKGEG